jgi:hypothetical protein
MGRLVVEKRRLPMVEGKEEEKLKVSTTVPTVRSRIYKSYSFSQRPEYFTASYTGFQP